MPDAVQEEERPNDEAILILSLIIMVLTAAISILNCIMECKNGNRMQFHRDPFFAAQGICVRSHP